MMLVLPKMAFMIDCYPSLEGMVFWGTPFMFWGGFIKGRYFFPLNC
jgi:hypothetical protein